MKKSEELDNIKKGFRLTVPGESITYDKALLKVESFMNELGKVVTEIAETLDKAFNKDAKEDGESEETAPAPKSKEKGTKRNDKQGKEEA